MRIIDSQRVKDMVILQNMAYRCGSCPYVSDRRENILRHVQRKLGNCKLNMDLIQECDKKASFDCRKGCGAVFKHATNRRRHEITCRFGKESITSSDNDKEDSVDITTDSNNILCVENNTPESIDIPCVEIKLNVENKDKHDNCIGYIYLIREREFLNSNMNVFKFGMTVQPPNTKISRIQTYKKGSEIILTMKVNDPKNTRIIETEIRRSFQRTFKNHPDGHEYFIGCPMQMTEIIFDLVQRYNKI